MAKMTPVMEDLLVQRECLNMNIRYRRLVDISKKLRETPNLTTQQRLEQKTLSILAERLKITQKLIDDTLDTLEILGMYLDEEG